MNAVTRIGSAALLLLLFCAETRAAQNAQLVAQGRLLAQSMCADCHSFGGAQRSDRASPDFARIGAMPSTTLLSLRVFLKSPHANMPDLILTDPQIDAISAFIFDLAGR